MWCLLLIGLAFAQDEALEQRLLGPAAPTVGPAPPIVGPASIEVAPAALPAPATPAPAAIVSDLSWLDSLEQTGAVQSGGANTSWPWWVPMVALLGAGGFYWTRRKAATSVDDDLPIIRVVARTAIAGTTSVAIVEVQDGNRRRRLLVGTGDKNPVLLTELTEQRQAPERRPAIGVETRDDFPEDTLRPVSPRSAGLSKALSQPKHATPTHRPAQDWMAADPSSEIGPRKAAAHVLISQEMTRRTGT